MAYSESKVGHPVYSENLENVGREYGLEGLMMRFAHALGRVGLAENELIQTTLALGVDLHEGDRRTHEPYIYHPVRVGIRLIEELGVTDAVTIASAPVHDTIEDHPDELAKLEFDDVADEPHLQRQLAHSALALIASEEVADVVLEVSNPIIDPGDDKIEVYAVHTARLVVYGSPRATVLKLADFLDNSGDAEGEDPQKRTKLDRKQRLVYGMHAAALARTDSLVPPEAKPGALIALSHRHLRALGRLTERAAKLSA
jgi:(p)ppGpp synthase/HD superfamily hydrolase